MNYTEFSKKIKEKYPYYNKVDDKVLAEKMIAKYPYYKDKVTFDIEEQPEGNSVKITDVFKNMLTPVTKPVETLTDTSVKIENTAEESVKPATQAISETVKNLNPIEQTKDIVNSATVKPYRNVEPSLRARTEEDDNSKVIYEPDSFDILGEQIAVASASDKGATSTKDLENIRKKQNMAIMTAGVVPFVAGGQMSVGGLAILEGIQQAKNYVSSKIQGKDYDFMAYENLSSLLPDNTPSVVRVVSSLAEMVGDCIVAGKVESSVARGLINEAVNRFETRMAEVGYNEQQIQTASNNLKKKIVERTTGKTEQQAKQDLEVLKQKAQGKEVTDIVETTNTEPKPINIDEAVKLRIGAEKAKIPEPPKETIKADVEVEPITEPKQIKPVEEVKTVEEVKPTEEIKTETSIEPSKTKGNAKVVDKSINLERVAKILPQKSYEMDNKESLYRQTIYNTLIKDDVFTNGKVVIVDKNVAKKANEIAKKTIIEEFAKKQKGSKATKTKKATELYEEITKNTPTLYTKTIPDIKALIKKGSDGSEKTIIIDTEDEGRWSILGDNKTVINTGIYNAVQKEFNNELEIFLNKNKDVALLKDKNGNIKAILPASKTERESKKEELNRTIKILEENIEGLNEERKYNLKHNYSTSVLDLNIKDTQEKLAKTKKELDILQKEEGTEKTPDSLTATQRRGVSGATNNIEQNQKNGNNNLATSKTDFSQQTDVELPKVTKTHDELIKKSEIIRDLAKETDLPVKIGGTQRKNILGLYYMKEELVRLQVANDMLTLAHEIGHHEEKVLFGGVYRKFKDFTPEQKEFYKELKPLATKPAGNETRGKMFSEGMAQFISMFVNNPEQAQKVAPKFYEYFTKNAPEKTPKVYNALVKAQTRMSKYYTQNNINKVKNHISFERETEKLTPKEWFDKKLTQARTQLFDRLEPLRKSVQEIYKRAGLNISDTDPNNPYFIARLNSGSVGRAETFIKKHTYDFNTLQKTGKGLQTIIQEVEKNGGNLEDFATYLVAHDTVELAPRGIKTGVELEDAIKTVAQLEPIYGNYAKDLYQYRLSLLKMLKDGQIINQEAYNNIVNKSERYAPLQRVLDDEVNTMAGNKNFKSSNPLKNIKGSGRDIINPLETIVNETYNIINLVEKNRVGLALAKLSNLDRSGAFIFKRPHKIKAVNTLEGGQVLTSDKTIDKNNEIKVFIDGKPVVYEVAPEIAKIVNGLTIENQILYTRWLENVATIPARALKFGATDVNLAFAFKNILRDLPLALVSSENKFSEITKSVLNMTVLGLKAMVNEKSRAEWNDIVDLYTKSGAGQSLLINDNRDTTIKAIDDLRYTGYLDKIWNKVKEKDFIEATKTGIIGTTELVRSIVGFLEQVPRLAEFVASLKGKPLTKENIEKAGFNARKITLDFASGGSFSKYVNKYVPYTNAFFLGIDKLKEVFKDQKQFKRLLAMLGVYAMVRILANILDADSEEVDDVNRTQKYTNFVFKIGDTIFRIPKTIELAPFYTTIDTAISLVADTIKGKKKENAEYIRDIVGSMKANLFPNVIAQAVKLPIELYANKSMFFGTPIVSAELEKALPEYQYTEYTTELSKFIAKTLGNIGINKGFIADTIGSPQRLEYIVNSLAGNTGKYLFEKVDQIGRLTGVLPNKEYELPEKTLADIPFARAFVIRYPQQSRTIEDFYEKYKELKQYSNSFRLSKKRADIQAIQELAIYKSVDKVDKITKTMGDVRKTILTVYTDKNMSKDEKRQNIDELMLMRLALAKQGLNMMKEIEQNIKGEL